MDNTFANIIQTSDIKYKHAKGMRDVYGKEFHHFHELFLFIGGSAIFRTEHTDVELQPYTLIVIPANTFHYFHVNGSEADYERYVFNFYNIAEMDLICQKMNGVSIISSLPDSIVRDFTSLDDPKYTEAEKNLLVRAKLLSVLIELGHLIPNEEQTSSSFSAITTNCLHYINKNIFSALSVTRLSEELKYSRSSIMHAFKTDLGIPLYKFIIEKKLLYAHKDIKAGLSATEAAQKYGFSDYSCFYRSYKKFFGSAPSSKSSEW